jgi:hypothetical protein
VNLEGAEPVNFGPRKMGGDRGLDGKILLQGALAFPSPHGGPLHRFIRCFPLGAAPRQFEQNALAEIEPFAQPEIAFHVLRVNDQALDQPPQGDQEIIEEHARIRHDDPFD